ncbi:hypothetical protein [Globicatella sp. PHS-GS-PNBC-21-1553]|uniref:hypothetical protein n=1 Tax=Globicatella sp. PHS-GS-PNBC-21-1553 TaxID=2885764 RepID=UPI00298F2857|nr:hypothetical protein [Globicatella sp. PHS-GS-PNBC-21-1553]WPC08795.1 hypothetical protein LB888_00620 [Globicatella sp. PHS-GS-PNBC-21-1553]
MTNKGTLTKSQVKSLENGIDRINEKIENYSKNNINLTQSQRDDLENDLRKLYGQLNSFIGAGNNRKRMNKPAPKRKEGSNTNLLLGFIVNADRMVTSLNDIITAKVESDFKTKQAKKAEAERTIKAIETCYGKPQRSWDYFQSV